MKRLRIGTGNPGKLREYEQILAPVGYELIPVQAPDPDETAPDLDGNARLKAVAYAAACGEITIAEDAGLVVPALSGLPGVISARFSDCEVDVQTGRMLSYTASGQPRDKLDARNREKLLALLSSRPESERAAYFQVVLAVASPDGQILFTATGEAHGTILHEARGEGGFGYDSIFGGAETGGASFAEVSKEQKNAISHRRKAIDALRRWLAERG